MLHENNGGLLNVSDPAVIVYFEVLLVRLILDFLFMHCKFIAGLLYKDRWEVKKQW